MPSWDKYKLSVSATHASEASRAFGALTGNATNQVDTGPFGFSASFTWYSELRGILFWR